MTPEPIDLRTISADVLALLTAEVARTYKALPVRLDGGKLVIAVLDPKDIRVVRAIQFATEREIVAVAVPAPVLDAAIQRHYAAARPAAPAPPAKPAVAPEPASMVDDLGLDDLLGAAAAAPAAPPRPAPAAVAAAPAVPPPVQKPVVLEAQACDPGLLDKPAAAALALVSADTARSFHILPLLADDRTITVAFAGAVEPKALRAVQYATQRRVQPVLAPREALEAAILRHYPAQVPKAPVRSGPAGPSLDPRLLAEIDPDIIALLRVDAARKYKAVPVEKMGRRLTVAMENPGDLEAVRDLEFVCGLTIKALRCDGEALAAAVEKYYPPEAMVQAEKLIEGAEADLIDSVEVIDEDAEAETRAKQEEVRVHDLEDESGDLAPAVKLSNMLIREAVARGASDIHIETYENRIRVRYRVDGVLYEVAHPSRELRDALISRIKVVAGMNIAETRLPQDGRVKLKMKAGERVKNIDLRVSDVPTIWGEKIVMRVLDPDRLQLDLTRLGLEPESLVRFQRNIVKPYGMCLVVGPSGCGKTNTLYSAMSAVNNSEVNIMTAEDPVEFNIRGINQVQADERVGLTFATALRSFLRQDPNIILVGEIRDFETAEIAIKASLTGHLVLSTLHTTDAPTTISRLVNMGVEPFLVASSMLLISAQRLVRKVCEDCKEPDPRPDEELFDLGFLPDDLPVTPMKGRGCRNCHMTGLRGRTAVFEVLEIDDDIRELILHGATPVMIKQAAADKGMFTLRRSGLIKIKAGITTVEEVTRETVL